MTSSGVSMAPASRIDEEASNASGSSHGSPYSCSIQMWVSSVPNADRRS